jgi:hypothetical protein
LLSLFNKIVGMTWKDLADRRKPDYRGIFRDDALTLIRHLDWMPSAYGFARTTIRENASATLADFEILRGGDALELVVTQLTTTTGDGFRNAVIGFAQPLGYRRVWMGHEVIELDPFVEAGDTIASTTCGACQSVFAEDAPEFMLKARQLGVFPPLCPIDGFPLAQWKLDRRGAPEVVDQQEPGESVAH